MSRSKEEIRRRVRKVRQGLSPATRAWYDQTIRSRLTRMPAWSHARAIGLYVSLPEEPGTAALIETALSLGKRVALPRVAGEAMTYHLVADLGELSPGAFGLMAPAADAPVIAPESLDLIVAPGVAFDRQGNRLGFGRGYFDRTLADYEGALIGLAWPEMMVESIPADPWDKRMKQVVTADARGAERNDLAPDPLSRHRGERR